MKTLKKGFTLIELLIVIAIIAILAVIIITNVANARVKATRARILSDLATGVKTYSACQAFGGTPALAVSNTPTCNTSLITDTVEKSSATGNWPTILLASGYLYVPPGSLSDVTVAHGGATSIGEVQFGGSILLGNPYAVCTPTGCSTGNAW